MQSGLKQGKCTLSCTDWLFVGVFWFFLSFFRQKENWLTKPRQIFYQITKWVYWRNVYIHEKKENQTCLRWCQPSPDCIWLPEVETTPVYLKLCQLWSLHTLRMMHTHTSLSDGHTNPGRQKASILRWHFYHLLIRWECICSVVFLFCPSS